MLYAFGMLVYLNGQYSPVREATLSALDRGFVFGDGVYEVWRVVRGQMFEAERHQARLERGLSELRIARPKEGSLDGITAIGERLLRENGLIGGEATLYVEITRGAAPRTHYFPAPGTAPTMLVMASAFTPARGALHRDAGDHAAGRTVAALRSQDDPTPA